MYGSTLCSIKIMQTFLRFYKVIPTVYQYRSKNKIVTVSGYICAFPSSKDFLSLEEL